MTLELGTAKQANSIISNDSRTDSSDRQNDDLLLTHLGMLILAMRFQKVLLESSIDKIL